MTDFHRSLDAALHGETRWPMNTDLSANTVYVVTGPRGFTETFDERTVRTLVALGLVRHVSDGYAIEDSYGNGVGPVHRHYGPAA